METKPSKRVGNQVRILHYEKELKMLVRQQLDRVEPGLVEADGGREREVASGRIDITARDRYGNFVVIELKAGPCPNGALEQMLAYSADMEAETGVPCRAVLLAAEFSPRLESAAKRAHDVFLVRYALSDMACFAPAETRTIWRNR
jgi:RecB family endonuclease NucS